MGLRRSSTTIGLKSLLAAAILCTSVPGATQPSDQVVKAAFLPKFARYVAWPPPARPGTGDPIVLCIVGTDSFGPLIDRAAASQGIEQHQITVRRMASTAQADGCHIAYVKGSTPQATAAMIASLRGKPVLTVTDGALAPTRGIVDFVIKDGRVRFTIDNVAALDSKLTIDSRLLGIAVAVRQKRS